MLSPFRRRRPESIRCHVQNQVHMEQLEERTLLSTLGQIGGPAGSVTTAGTQAMDAQGNAYLSGQFTGTVDFDPGSGVVERTSDAAGDTFIAKYTSQGALSWVRQIGSDAYANGVALDPAGVPHVFGSFTGTADFGSGNILVSPGANEGPFMLKMDPATGVTIWARTGGTSMRGYSFLGASVGADGSVFGTGSFSQQTDFDPLRSYPDNRDILTATGWTTSRKDKTNYQADAFVWKLDSAGNFVSVFKVGGTQSDRGEKVSVDVTADGNGSLYLMTSFQGTADFDPGTAVSNRISDGLMDVGYAKYAITPSTATLGWVQSIGGAGSEVDWRFGVDSQHVYIAGSLSTAADFDPSSGTRTITPDAGGSAAIAKYRKSDGGLEWVGQLNGPGSTDVLSGIAMDAATGMLYIGGSYSQAMNYVSPQGVSSTPLSNAGMDDGFVLKLDSMGTYQEAWRMGGLGLDKARVIGVYGGTVVITGRFEGTANFPTGGSLTDLGGGHDAFLMTLGQPAPSPLLAAAVPARSVDQSLTVFHYEPIGAESLRRREAVGVNTSTLTSVNVQVKNPGGTTPGLAVGVRNTSLVNQDSQVVDAVFSQFSDPHANNFLSTVLDEHRWLHRPRLQRRK